jgi:hypothetical protein
MNPESEDFLLLLKSILAAITTIKNTMLWWLILSIVATVLYVTLEVRFSLIRQISHYLPPSARRSYFGVQKKHGAWTRSFRIGFKPVRSSHGA